MALLYTMRSSASPFRRPSRPGPGRRLGSRLTPRGRKEGETMAGFRRWRSVVAVAAATLALNAAGPLPAALATVFPSPSMTANNGSVNIAIQGPHNSLLFYWATNGTTAWHTETVAGAGSTFNSPAMAVNGNTVNIAAQGPNDTLLFYWATTGTSTWHEETVAGPGSTTYTPSIVINGNTVNIAAVGPHNSLNFYWAYDGTATWHAETVSTNAFSTPSMTVDGNTFYITANGYFGQLWVWSKVIGVGTWQSQNIGQNEFAYFPAITANGNTVDIAVANQYGGALDLYSAVQGSSTWHKQTVAGPGGTIIVPVSIAVNQGTLTIATAGGTTAQTQLLFYWAANGSSTWHRETVASSVNNSTAPSITANGNAANIADITPAGDLEFYWAADGTTTWSAEPVPGNGSGPNA